MEKERQYERDHATRAGKINRKYDARVAPLNQQIMDWQAVQPAVNAAQQAEYQRMIQRNLNHIQQIEAERQRRLQDSQDILDRQRHSLWSQ